MEEMIIDADKHPKIAKELKVFYKDKNISCNVKSICLLINNNDVLEEILRDSLDD